MMPPVRIHMPAFFRRARSPCTICLAAVMAWTLIALGPGSAAAQVPGDLPPLPPGLYNRTLPRGDDPAVHYAISIPRSYSPGTPAPLVLALHFGVRGGASAGAGGSVLQLLVAPALANLGAVIVAPDSVRGDWSTAENEKAVNALLDEIMAHYAIDVKKVVVTGYSMGGAGAWHLAQKYPQRFSAAVPVAGRPPAKANTWRLPVLAIHSHSDQVVPFGPTETRIAELQEAGVNAKLIALDGITHYETTRFRDSLRQAVPWLREVWKQESPRG